MYGTNNRSPADEEAIDVLIAISNVSARLARKLTILAAQSKLRRTRLCLRTQLLRTP